MRPLLFIVLCFPLAAADIAVLQTGARMRATRIERADGACVLHTEAGRIELDCSQIASVEHEDDPPVPAVPEIAPEPPKRILSAKELVTEAAQRHGLPAAIVHALAMTESAYNPKALSPKGAIGVMQLMPGTAQTLSANPYDVEQNIDAGTRLFRDLLIKYQNDANPVRRALAAYNAGEGAVARYGGVPPYRETQAYVERVIERYWRQVSPSTSKPH